VEDRRRVLTIGRAREHGELCGVQDASMDFDPQGEAKEFQAFYTKTNDGGK